MDSKFHICDVCRLLDGDTLEKLCGYCNLCDAWICTSDQSKWSRRLLAASKRKLEPGYKGQKDYIAQVQKQAEEEKTYRLIPDTDKMEIKRLHENLLKAKKEVQDIETEISVRIDGLASNLKLSPNDYMFDIETLIFKPRNK